MPRMQTLREHQGWMLGREIAGRIYISAQGINAQYSGPTEDALAYARWVAAQPGFEVPLCEACCMMRRSAWALVLCLAKAGAVQMSLRELSSAKDFLGRRHQAALGNVQMAGACAGVMW